MNSRPSFWSFLGAGVWLAVAGCFPVVGRAGSFTSTVMSVAFDQPISPDALREEGEPAAAPGPARLVITIDAKREFQVIEGIGGAFNEIGGEALTHLDQEQRPAVLKSLFDPDTGAGFTFCRLPIGASDFALSAYSLNDEPGDYAMRHFSALRDEKFLIPYVRDALAINPSLRLHACPWSPPGWLKTNGRQTGGGQLRDAPEVYRAYASYLRRFLEAYADRGIQVHRLFVQNEPNIELDFPTCAMPPEQMIKFVVDYLAPEFSTHEIATEIWAGTFQESKQRQLAHACLADARFRRAVRGAGFQYSDPALIQDLQLRYPGLKVMHTEARCQNGENTVEQARALFGEIVQSFRARGTAFTYWNMVLNEHQRSTWNWPQNSLLTVGRPQRQVTYHPDYAVMALVGRSVRPGAKWLVSSSEPPRPVACFRDRDGSLLTLIWNEEKDATPCDVVAGDLRTRVILPGQSLSAIRTKPPPP